MKVEGEEWLKEGFLVLRWRRKDKAKHIYIFHESPTITFRLEALVTKGYKFTDVTYM